MNAEDQIQTPTPEPAADETDTAVEVTPAHEAEAEEAPMFDADYVKRLRSEAAEYRVKAKRADALAKQALTAMVEADGRLIDPTDMTFTDDLLTKDGTLDAQAVQSAIDALIEAKPHMARKRPTAPLAQGVRAHKSEPNLLQLIQAGT